VHEDRLELERLAKYRALLLPNIAMLSDKQCEQLREYVRAGGSLMASFETSLYDENLKQRDDFGLAELMGVSKAGATVGTNGNPYSARIETKHEVLKSFESTTWIAGAENRVPLKPLDGSVLTVVPGFVRYPPELAYPTQPKTDEPGIVLRESGKSRTVWIPGDVERTYWITGHGDLLRLLQNAIRWVSHDEQQVRVDGPGLIEVFCWETAPGYAVHLLNYNTPNAFHGWVESATAVGPQRVAMKLPSGVGVKSVELLRSEQRPPFVFRDQVLQLTVPQVGAYEVAAVTVA
jgi:hypothetical protein